jgi:hypothetical protein
MRRLESVCANDREDHARRLPRPARCGRCRHDAAPACRPLRLRALARRPAHRQGQACRSSSTLAQKRICRFHRVDRVSPRTSPKRTLTQPRGTPGAPVWITPGAGSMDPPLFGDRRRTEADHDLALRNELGERADIAEPGGACALRCRFAAALARPQHIAVRCDTDLRAHLARKEEADSRHDLDLRPASSSR